MDKAIVRQNTVKLHFGSKSFNPSNQEMFSFFRKQGWDSEMLSAMYREDYSIMVKFQSERITKRVLMELGPVVTFEYENGTTLQVAVSAAGGTFKYIRVFGLPPEVEDKHIAAVFEKYGTIQQMIRERFHANSGFPIWTGVRGIHLEVKEEIPAQVFIQHIKARVYYDGLQNKCFSCGSTEHLKVDCPKRPSVNDRLGSNANNKGSNGNDSISGNGSGGGSSSCLVNDVANRQSIIRPEEFPNLPGQSNGDMEVDNIHKNEENGAGWQVIKSKEQLKRTRNQTGQTADPAGSGQTGAKKIFAIPREPILAQIQQRRSRSATPRKTATTCSDQQTSPTSIAKDE